MRTSSTAVRPIISLARLFSAAEGAPNDKPLVAASWTASTIAGWALPWSIGPQEDTKSTYSFPSTSRRWLPLAESMNTGVPPTEPNARTGEFTPPGINSRACENKSLLRVIVFMVGNSAANCPHSSVDDAVSRGYPGPRFGSCRRLYAIAAAFARLSAASLSSCPACPLTHRNVTEAPLFRRRVRSSSISLICSTFRTGFPFDFFQPFSFHP